MPPSLEGLTDKQTQEMVRDDWHSAVESRHELEERKLKSYKLYRAWRDELAGHGKSGRGPFGWSKLTVPLIFWVTETTLPRIGVQPPTVIVNAKTPEAVPYAQAKQMRIQYHLRQAHMEEELLVALKSMLILGDGIVKVPWNPDTRCPGFIAVNWWDWFVSPEAERWHTAEVLYHRTWHTRRDLERLSKRTDEKGKPIYDLEAIEALASMGTQRSASDPTWQARRDTQGIGWSIYARGDEPVPVIEAWYRDGARVTFGGDDLGLVLRVVDGEDYVHRTPKGQPYRPFSVFQNTPDLYSPYSISDAEMLEGHQAELSTLRNQYIDQITMNLNAPLGYDNRRVRPEQIDAAFGQPGGKFGTDGPPQDAVARFTPGSTSRDFSEVYDNVRGEAQIVAGVSDYAAGMGSAPGVDNQTATGISLITQEANKRFQSKLKFVELAMRRVAEIYDWLDRSLGSNPIYTIPEQDPLLEPGTQGVTMRGKMAMVSGAPNDKNLDYEIDVDAGAMAPPATQEQARKVMTLVQAIAVMPPQAQQTIDWQALLKQVVEAHGMEPDRVINPQLAMPTMGMPGEVPVGPPEPVDQSGEVPVGPPEPVQE
jgi:hypothetical protein